MTQRERLQGSQAFQRFERLTGIRLSETELEAYQERAREAGVDVTELFERATSVIERNLARLEANLSKRTLH